jgi:hypothetical protein
LCVEEPRLPFFEPDRGVSFFFSPPPPPVYNATELSVRNQQFYHTDGDLLYLAGWALERNGIE